MAQGDVPPAALAASMIAPGDVAAKLPGRVSR